MIRFSLAATVCAFILSGCGAISALGDAGTPLDAYELQAPGGAPVATRRLARDLVIELPSTSGAFETDRIMIREAPLQVQYLPGARWTAETPQMLQTVMLRAFDNTNGLRYVGRRPLGSTGDFALITELTDFQAVLNPDDGSATVTVRLTARLVREDDASVLGKRNLNASAIAVNTDTLNVVQAFNAATDILLPELTEWVLGRLGVSLSRGTG